MSDKGQVSNLAGVHFERPVVGPIDRVWSYLTDTHLLPGWYGEDSYIEPRQGGIVRLMGGHIRGTVTQWQPRKKLVYTWNVFNPDDKPNAVSAFPESYPTFELDERPTGIWLSFSHFPIPERFVAQSALGWHTMLDMIAAALAHQPVEDRMFYMRQHAATYGVDLDNLAG